MDPHEITGLELDISPTFVGLNLVVLIELLYSCPHLSMKLLDLFDPFVSLPTKLSACGDGSEIKGSTRIYSIDHLERRETCGLTRSPIECELGMA